MEITTSPRTSLIREHLAGDELVAERTLDIAGIATPMLEGGGGPPIVCLHGPGGFAGDFARVLPDLVATNRVVAADIPGQGDSDLRGVELTADVVLNWLSELIAATCERPPTLVGITMGGAIALRFAADRADEIERLVLADTSGLCEFQPAPEFGKALQEFSAEPTDETHLELMRHCMSDIDRLSADLGPGFDRLRSYQVDRAQDPDVAAASGTLIEAFVLPEIPSEELERIQVPTNLIWGRLDKAAPLAVGEDASRRYGWPLEVIEGSGDEPQFEQPQAFVDAVRACLGEEEGR